MTQAVFEHIGVLIRIGSFAWHYIKTAIKEQKRLGKLTLHINGFWYSEAKFELSIKVYPSGEPAENNWELYQEKDNISRTLGPFTYITWYVEEFSSFYKRLNYQPLEHVCVYDDSSETNFSNGQNYFRQQNKWSVRIGTPTDNLGVSFFSDVHNVQYNPKRLFKELQKDIQNNSNKLKSEVSQGNSKKRNVDIPI